MDVNTLSVLLCDFDLGLFLHLLFVDIFVLGGDSLLRLLQPPEFTVDLSLDAHRLDASDRTQKQQIFQQHPHALAAGSQVGRWPPTKKTRCNFPLYFGSLSYRPVLSNAIQRCLKVSGCSFELIRNRLLSCRSGGKPEILQTETPLHKHLFVRERKKSGIVHAMMPSISPPSG